MLGMLVVSFVISIGLIWAASALARSKHWGKAGVCVLFAVATVPFLFCFSPALALQSILTVAFTLVCGAFRSKPRMVVFAAVGAMVASYGIMIGASLPKLHELSRLREKYPEESLSARLAYETTTAKVALHASLREVPSMSPEVERRLATFDEGMHGHGNSRQYMLASLHNRTSDAFVLARGFGPVRMLSVRAERVELPAQPPIPLPLPPDDYVPDQESSIPLANENPPHRGQPDGTELLAMHASGLEDLFDAERMGYIRDRDHVAGFVSHRFTNMPDLAAHKDQPQSSWKVARLELVSLLKHEHPMAYVSKNLPQMDKLGEIPTRALNDFERRSIDRLVSDEDLVTEEAHDRIRMIGSLRAAKSCLECHAVRRGDLLGALTYELVPVNPPRRKAAAALPPES
jgi:hypothetical protein